MTQPGTSQTPRHPLVVVLLGPTASGKTDLSIQIAEQLELSVLCVDSRQLYIGMNVGTAKPTKTQQKRVPHHLLDLRHPNQPITVQEFQETANLKINETLHSQGSSFLVGGSGLYLKAITAGLIPPPVPPQPTLRQQLSKLGKESCYELLKRADPEAARKISSADFVRTLRALEVLYASGRSITSQQKMSPPPWRVLELGLDPPDLRERIAQRTIHIYENGLIEETRHLINCFSPELPLLQTIGYKEALQVLEGRLNLETAISLTTRRTQQFAKRQRTWFRRQHQPHWLNNEEPLREALSFIKAGLV